MTQEEFNAMLAVGIAQGLPGSYYTSKYASGEEIDRLLGGGRLPTGGAAGALLGKQSVQDYDAAWMGLDQIGTELIKPDNPVGIAIAQNAGAGASVQNLIDNWYLVDPVNQRHQTSYSIRNYIIDRWLMGWNPTTLPDGAVFTAHYGEYSEWSGNGSWLIHRFPNAQLTGRMMTMSVLLANGTLLSGSAVYNMVADMSVIQMFFNVPGVMHAYAQSDETAGQWRIVLVNTSESPLQIVAVKLEFGSVQTLASQDADGKWVLKEPPPDKGERLAKCQYYFYHYEGPWVYAKKAAFNETPLINIPFPVTMRANPTIYNIEGTNDNLPSLIDASRMGVFMWGTGTTETMGIYRFEASADL